MLRLTLDRQETRNAFDELLIADLTGAFHSAAIDPACRVVLLQAAGGFFSAGADLAWMRRMADNDADANLRDAEKLAAMMRAIDICPKPTLARVQGSAFAGAVGLLACCDLVIAVPDAQFAITEVRLGLIPAVIAPYLVRAMGQRQVRRWGLTGERFSAAQAQAMGLVHEIADAAELDQIVARQIQFLLQGGPVALGEAKELLAAVDGPLDAAVIQDCAARIARVRASEEGREGVSAFLQKRPPQWRGGGV